MIDKEKQLIARESAKILIEEGVDDFHLAKQKAVKRLRLSAARSLPGNDEIEIAIGEYHRLFRARIQDSHVKMLREVALKAMVFLKRFSPRLVGNVVDGSAGRHSPVVIFLAAETPEPVVITFLNAKIPFTESSFSRWSAGRKIIHPAIHFMVDNIKVEANILPEIPFRESFQNRKLSTPYATIDQVKEILGNR